MRVHIQAALAGLQEHVHAAPLTDELAQQVLECAGDAMRAGLDLPASVRRWIRALPTTVLTGAMRLSIDETAEAALPRTNTDESLAFILVRRDAAESLRIAAASWCLAAGHAPAEFDVYQQLVDTLGSFGARLREVLDRHAAEAMLGERATLLEAQPWTAALDERTADVRDTPAPPWDACMIDATPSDELVTSYIRDGSHGTYIEGFAARSDDFAEELAALIDGAREDRSDVGIAARRWRKRCVVPGTSNPLTDLPALPRLRAAAATTASHDARVEVLRLGWLGDVRAQANLEATAAHVTLHVFGRAGDIEEVAFGDNVARVPTSTSPHGDTWSVTIPRPSSTVRVRVIGTGGRAFDESLQLGDADA